MEQRKLVPKGAVVLEQGMTGNEAYIIESGKIEISIKDPDFNGDDIILAELGPGTLIGEMAIMLDGRRCANARALEDLVLIVIPGQDLRQSVRLSNHLHNYLMELIALRVKDMQETLSRRKLQKLMCKTENAN